MVELAGIQDVLVIDAKTAKVLDEIAMKGLQMPRLRGVSISVGEPLSADQLGFTSGTPGGTSGGTSTGSKPPSRPLPVPVIPEECK